jgi:hypothetical protein
VRVIASVITGGRPKISDRPTAQFFPELKAAGFDIEWVVRGDHAAEYEPDAQPFNVYTPAWANTYARGHWRHPTVKWEPGGFFGAAPGREWAMQSAEERGYDAVLQLDDNITHLGLLTCSHPACRAAMAPGVMLSLLAELAASTNAMMLGAQLNSAVPRGKVKMARVGFPYSCFIEKCGPGRMPYYGPFEDDIMHAMEYGLHGGPGRTAGVVEVMRYLKESQSKTGMRKHYNHARGLELPRRYPNNAKLRVSNKTTSPNAKDGAKAVRHFLSNRGFTPIRVTDPARYTTAEKQVRLAVAEAQRLKVEWDRGKIRKRAGLPPTPGSIYG